uniref:Uncharacterized protein n=1 Tax=Setaria italica TaxID=4555 RepID=K3Y441_SETIT
MRVKIHLKYNDICDSGQQKKMKNNPTYTYMYIYTDI